MARTAASAASRAARLVRGQDQEVAARDRALHAECVLAEELPVHHRDPPVAPPVELLARLVAVPEEAQESPDLHRLLPRREPVEAGRGGTGHHALADAVDQRLAQRRGVEPEDQEAHARVGRRASPPPAGSASMPGLGVAADHRRRVARRQRGRRASPAGRLGGHDRAGRAHLEGLGERVLDLHAVDAEHDGRSAGGRRRSRRAPAGPGSPGRAGRSANSMVSPPAACRRPPPRRPARRDESGSPPVNSLPGGGSSPTA